MTPEDSGRGDAYAGRYRRMGRLGTGGMASVYLAEDQVLCRKVAIKRVHTASPEDMLRRFRREARIGASLNHPNIVGVFDSVSEEDTLEIVMEYVEGESLSERLRRSEMDSGDALAILGQIASALDHIHSRDVIHRDVKPSNILIRNDGVAKLADLGIATATDMTAITASGSVLGSLSYIAPERLRGGHVDSSCDIFSLGAVAFEMLAGRRLHHASTPEEQIRLATSGSTPDLIEAWPEAPARAAAVLASAMDPDPRKRPASAADFVASLRQALADGGPGDEATQPLTRETQTVPLRPPEPPRPRIRRAAPAPPDPLAPPRRPESLPLSSPKRRGRGGAIAALALAVLALGAVAIAASQGGGDGGSGGTQSAGKKQDAKDSAQSGGADTQSAGAGTPAGETSSATAGGTSTTAATPAPSTSPPSTSGYDLNAQGKALLDAGDPVSAIPYFQQAVDSYDPNTDDINYAYALFNLGTALRQAGQPEEAIKVLKKRLKFPDQTATVQAELDLAIEEAKSK